jgi:hypothetical protein
LKLHLLFAGVALAYSVNTLAAPIIEGNTSISNHVIDRHLGYGKPQSIEDAARIVAGVYAQYGLPDAKITVQDNTIVIDEYAGARGGAWFPKDDGFAVVEDIQSSMRMADVTPRFQVIDNLLGNLQGTSQSGRGLSSKKDIANLGISYSSQGQDANGRDVVGINGSIHASNGFSAEGQYLHGLEGLRTLSKEGRYDAGRVRLAQNTQYGEFSLAGEMSGADVGRSKKVSRYQEELSGETHRAAIGHRYSFEGIGTLANTFGWTHREQTYDKYGISENQDYQTWNTTYKGQFGASQISASVTKGLSGSRSFDYVPLMGSFNPHFYAAQLGYGIQGLALGDQLGYGVSGSYFRGSDDMPSAERMTIGGSGRGSSHEPGVVSGYKGGFAEARLYGMKVPGLSDFSLKPYVSVNGSRTTHPTGGEYEVVSSEVGIIGRWSDVSSTISYAKSVKDVNLDHDSRLNVDVNYTF